MKFFQIGESGRSPKELERIISVLKKAVDKKRSEIEEIKVSAASLQFSNFRTFIKDS